VLRRVQISRLSVDYAIVERARLELAGRLPLNNDLKLLARERFESYIKTLACSSPSQFSEGAPFHLEDYCKALAAGLGITDI
jgi:hypothetical protein